MPEDTMARPESCPNNVLLLVSTLGLGGTPKHVYEHAISMLHCGVNVEVWNFGHADRYHHLLVDAGVKVREKNRLIPDLPLYLRGNPFSVVHSYLFGSHCLDALATRLFGNKYIKSVRNQGHWRRHTLIERIKQKIGSFCCDLYIPNSELGANDIITNDRISPDRIRVIANGMIDRRSAWPSITRKELLLTDDDFVMIAVERLQKRKNTSFLIHRLKSVQRSVPNAKLIVVGYGPQKRDLMQVATDEGVIDSCRFLGFQEYPYAFTRIADAFASASTLEGLSNSLLEAMMMGVVPVVPEGHDTVVEHMQNGIRYDLTDDSFERAIAFLANSPAEKDRLSSTARAYYESHHTIDVQTSAYLDAYCSLPQ